MASASNSALRIEKGGGVAANPTPEDLDPFDIFGWDMPLDRTPKLSSPQYLTDAVLCARYRKIAAIMSAAEKQGYNLPWTITHLNAAKALFQASRGYTNIMFDMTQRDRVTLHGRRWDPLASTWLEKMRPPPNYGDPSYQPDYPMANAQVVPTASNQSPYGIDSEGRERPRHPKPNTTWLDEEDTDNDVTFLSANRGIFSMTPTRRRGETTTERKNRELRHELQSLQRKAAKIQQELDRQMDEEAMMLGGQDETREDEDVVMTGNFDIDTIYDEEGKFTIGVSKNTDMKGKPVRAQFDARKAMALKVKSNGKAFPTQLEYVKLDRNMLEDMFKNDHTKKGTPLTKEQLKAYLLQKLATSKR